MIKTDCLPVEYHRYFWDTDVQSISVKQNATFIIERLLESGDEKAVQWLFHQYSKSELSEVVRNSRRLSARSSNFWAYILDIPHKEILCLSKSFQKTYRAIWKH